jgi:hypothetical protein
MRFQRRGFSFNRPIRNKSRLWRPCLLTDRDEMSNLYRGPSIDASYQVSVHLRFFSSETAWLNGPKRGRKHLWELLIPFWSVNKHGHHRQFLFLIGWFLKQLFLWRFFRNQPIRNKNCLWWPCLPMDRDEMNTLYRGPSKDASYQVSIHLGRSSIKIAHLFPIR